MSPQVSGCLLRAEGVFAVGLWVVWCVITSSLMRGEL